MENKLNKNKKLINDLEEYKIVLEEKYSSKYSRWLIIFENLEVNPENSGFIDELGEKLFKKYNVHFIETKEKVKVGYKLDGLRPHRVRCSTFLKNFYKLSIEINLSFLNDFKVKPLTKSEIDSENENNFIISDNELLIDENYDFDDITVLKDPLNFMLWQNQLYDSFFDKKNEKFKKSNYREVTWVEDRNGMSGKSLFVKWCCVCYPDQVCKLTFGTPSQLRTGILSTKVRNVYFLDVPKSNTESLDAIISVVEDLKNGHITSVMYGKMKSLIFNSPHVIIFSNMPCPKKKLSEDRWKTIKVDKNLKRTIREIS